MSIIQNSSLSPDITFNLQGEALVKFIHGIESNSQLTPTPRFES